MKMLMLLLRTGLGPAEATGACAGPRVQVSVSLMPILGVCISVAEAMLQVWTGRDLAEAFEGIHEPTSPGFCMLL